MDNFKLEEIEKALGVSFKSPKVIKTALTHSSYAKQFKGAEYNERLEFLGDSVLQLCITEHLFRNNKKKAEGELTKIRSLIVCEASLYNIAQKLNVGEFLRLSKGEILTGGRERISIQADAVEAIIAAIYLEHGYEEAKEFILDKFSNIIEKATNNKIIIDFKTELQEYLQRDGDITINYELNRFEGPPHRRRFYLNVYVKDKIMGEGSGYSKKDAEQNAAKKALIKLGVIDE